ncbi:MAG TPA: LuxR C-terminal-related transcriptional regulator [Acidimicrobiales bacterium]|nr:LuxR C-terminal-related transcriptional regulator [Acidimicrobiales bacterium]
MAWLDSGTRRYEEALAVAEQGPEYPDDIGLATWSVVELIEAAVRSGQTEKARAAIARLSVERLGSETDWAEGIMARCRAMVCDGEAADLLYRRSIELLGRTRARVELGRARLLYGEWLRRAGRRVDARSELRVACEMFEAMGLEGLAERALRELMATAETVTKRDIDSFDKLTPQEDLISRLAGSGYTNPEIGQKLFLSERTVEWHLRKVFVKLGIRSRRQLRNVLPAPQALPA